MPDLQFDEITFLWALTTRPEDARKFATTFKPSWLNTVELRPVLAEIYTFTRKKGEPPSLYTLHKIFKDLDEQAYNLRYKDTLDLLKETVPDRSSILYTLDQARDVAVVRSFLELSRGQRFIKDQVEFKGTAILKTIHSWLTMFQDTTEDVTLDLKQAVEHLIQTVGFEGVNDRIPVGINCIDRWTGGGLRPKQLGIVLAPTGEGKSALLTIMAHKISTIERKRIWVITNELSIEELTERMLTRLTGVKLDKIIEDPSAGYMGLGRHWRDRLDERFRITEMNREASSDDIESEMMRWANLYGWKPDVIILDFMERMKPALGGYNRDKEWQWIGAIAKDLVRVAKRHKLLVWTAAQFNRMAFEDTDIKMDKAQGSIRHLQEATAVIGMKQTLLPQRESKVIQFKPLKMRQSAMSAKSVFVECDLAKMNITNIEIEIKRDDDNGGGGAGGAGVGVGGGTPRQNQASKKKRSNP